MRIRFVIALVALTLAGTARMSAQSDTAAGLQVYTAQKCAICHAIAGKGNARGALDDVGSRLTAAEIREWIVDATTMAARAKATRKPAMKDYKLPPQELDALVAYLGSLKKK